MTLVSLAHAHHMEKDPRSPLPSLQTGRSLLIGESAIMKELRATIHRVASTSLPVLIQGPTGAGKELVAQAIHHESGRKGKLVAFNVAALSESLFESELFGHVRGAFTGAVHARPGLLRRAHNGTAFFDEIGELSLAMQAKLLRVLENGTFLPVGAEMEVSTDFRVVAATNVLLTDAISEGTFRQDLWFRLQGVMIRVPSLRERPEDIPMLVEHFLLECQQGEQAALVKVTDRALADLQRYAWPGNVRELKQAVRRLAAYSRAPVITEHELRLFLPELTTTRDESSARPITPRAQLLSVLQRHHWDINEAAVALGVNRSTLYRRMKRAGIPVRRSMDGYES